LKRFLNYTLEKLVGGVWKQSTYIL